MKVVLKVIGIMWSAFGVAILLCATIGMISYGPKEYLKEMKKAFWRGYYA